MADKRLVFTSSPDQISRRGPVIITIGTPIDEFLNPVRKVVQDCIEAILPSLNDGQLVVLRSTVFPGTTDWMMSYFTARGRNLKLAFCPERVVQGNGFLELRMMPQIISGTTKEAETRGGGIIRAYRSGSRRRLPDRGRARQVVLQCLSIHRVCRDQ